MKEKEIIELLTKAKTRLNLLALNRHTIMKISCYRKSNFKINNFFECLNNSRLFFQVEIFH